jgi:hypothetical protein
LVALVGCGNAGDLVASDPTEPTDDTAQTQPTEAVAPKPEDGACRKLRMDDIQPPTNDDRTVPCGRRHTAVTYYVGEWPADLVESAAGVNDPELKQYVFTKCDRSWRRTVGGSLEDWVVSIVSWAWYRPAAEQFDAGADWFRCDLVVGQNTDRLERLPADVEGMLDGRYDDRYRACWTRVFSDKPGADEGTLISCARDHRQRAIGIVQLGTGNEKYPGQQATFNRSNDLCADAVAKWRKAKQPGQFGLQWPHRDEWNDGERYATCWAVTRN